MPRNIVYFFPLLCQALGIYGCSPVTGRPVSDWRDRDAIGGCLPNMSLRDQRQQLALWQRLCKPCHIKQHFSRYTTCAPNMDSCWSYRFCLPRAYRLHSLVYQGRLLFPFSPLLGNDYLGVFNDQMRRLRTTRQSTEDSLTADENGARASANYSASNGATNGVVNGIINGTRNITAYGGVVDINGPQPRRTV
jgi:hypothetical protein